MPFPSASRIIAALLVEPLPFFAMSKIRERHQVEHSHQRKGPNPPRPGVPRQCERDDALRAEKWRHRQGHEGLGSRPRRFDTDLCREHGWCRSSDCRPQRASVTYREVTLAFAIYDGNVLEARNFRASSILSGQQVRRIDRCSRVGLSQQVLQGSQLIVNVNRVTNDERFGGTFAMNRLALAQQACDECGPTGLVGGTAASTARFSAKPSAP